ncbi:MAG: hypothetical protein HY716_04035 [Planctomycetes bacterium]|nr:hypothetical protein [Planctomycetota bacterium]
MFVVLPALEIRLRAEPKLGGIPAEEGERRGGAGGGASKLPDGISKKDSHRWQRVAELSGRLGRAGLPH